MSEDTRRRARELAAAARRSQAWCSHVAERHRGQAEQARDAADREYLEALAEHTDELEAVYERHANRMGALLVE